MKNYLNKPALLSYITVWRWHFYAGLFCIPFIILLSITGAIYLFKPQYEAFQNSDYNHLPVTNVVAGKVGISNLSAAENAKSAKLQVLAALAAVADSDFNAYQLPQTAQAAAQVMLVKNRDLYRVFVNPFNLQVLKIEREDDKLMTLIHHLHGQLLLGDRGSNIVELAASWAIVMIITGLFLWWPRNLNSLAGILYPRLASSFVIRNGQQVKSRLFWRDLHAVIGFWVSFLTLFLLISGLPWAKSWGGILKELRNVNSTMQVKTPQDWTTGRASELEARQLIKPAKVKIAPIAMTEDEHAQHQAMQHKHAHQVPTANFNALDNMAENKSLNQMVENVKALHLAYPVLVAAPSKRSPNWTAKSDAQNRPLRVNLELDANTGNILARKNFADRGLLDRIIGFGISIHEGQLFGWLNQLLGLLTALSLITVSVSGVVMWWRRRRGMDVSANTLGAPIKARRNAVRTPFGILTLVFTFAILLPFLGLSLLMILAFEYWILPRLPKAANFLGVTIKPS